MAERVPLVDYLVLDDPPHLVAQPVQLVRRQVLRPAQRLCGMRQAEGFTSVDVPTEGELRSFTIVAYGRARHSGAVRGRPSSTATARACAATSSTSSPTPSTCTLGMKVRLTTFPIGTDSAGTEAIGFGFEPLEVALTWRKTSGSSGSR